ncbi:MAG: ATP-binding protein [Planctomycetota bacterium]
MTDTAIGQEQDQISKLSADLVKAYEALTLVYRTVSNLGGLFRVGDITAYLVNRALEAAEASSAVLYLLRADGVCEVSAFRGALKDQLVDDVAARLLQLGRPLFFRGELASQYLRPGVNSPWQILSAPLETGGRSLGVIVLARENDRRFTTGDVKLVFALSGLTAVAVANFQHYRAVSYEREMLESVIREIGDGIVVADSNWRARLTNDVGRKYLGVADTEPEGYDVLRRIGAYSLSVPVERVRVQAGGMEEFTAESFDQRNPVVLGCKAFCARLGTEAELIRVLCLRDVTVEHRTTQAQNDFMSLAAHKLRTPLTKIMGLLPLARDTDTDDQIRAEAFDGIDSGSEELHSLVDGVLQFVEFRQGACVVQSVELRPLLREVVAAVRERRPRKELDVRIEIDRNVPPVRGSRQMLFTLFEKLIDNAVKFTPGSRALVRVEISSVAEDRIRIVVEDKGEGIPPDVLRRLFRPFSQRDEDFTGQAEGAGLGLMLVRQVVERHGGKIHAESRPGDGARFVVEIRIEQEGSPT